MGKRLFSSFLTVLVLLGVFCVLNINDVSAAITLTINTPSDDGVINGTFNFSATIAITGDGDENATSNCSWSYRAGSTGAWTVFASDLNETPNATHWSNAYDTTTAPFAENEDVQVNITCFNNSAGMFNAANSSATAITGLDIDNTAPTVSTITLTNENKIFYITNPVEIRCEGTDPGALSTTLKITKPSGKTAETSLTGTDAWKYQFKHGDTNEAGLYYVDCTVYAGYGWNRTVYASQKTFRVLYEDVGISEGEVEEKPVAKLEISTKELYSGIVSGKQGELKTFTLDGVTAHTLEFLEVTFTSAKLKINPEITLDIGKYKNIDLDGDGTDDVKVTLESIDENGRAKVEVINLVKMEEKLAEEKGIVPEVEEKPSKAGLWLTILVILVVIAVGYYLLKKRKDKKGSVKFSKQDMGL